jgi:transposase-like protein
MPFEILVDELGSQFGSSLTLSATAIVDWFKRHERLLLELYEQLKKIVLLLSHVHVDETGLPMKGKNWWTWVICNEVFVWFWQSHTRGHQAVEQILKDFEGVIVSDCWGAYNKLNSEQQKCLAHLITELKEILYRLGKESEEGEGKVADQETLQMKEETAAQEASQPEAVTSPPPRKRGRPKKQPAKLEQQAVVQLKSDLAAKGKTMEQAKRLKDFLSESWKGGQRGWQTPMDKRCSKQEAEQQFLNLTHALSEEGITDPRLTRVVDRGEKFAKSLFTYLDHEGIEPDNNEAERDLRPMVVQRKVSGSYKSPVVSEVYHLLKSLSITCQKNDKDFQALHLKLLSGEKVDLSQYFFE